MKLRSFVCHENIPPKLRALGYKVNKKQVQRVRREEGLQIPPRPPRRRRQGLFPRACRRKRLTANHVWAWDFVSDYTQRGGRLRAFNLIDEFTQECHCIHADRTIKAADVLSVLQEAIEEPGSPEDIRSDNGPKFIAEIIQQWLRENNIKTLYINPGCPWQNGYAESFNGRFRTECLDRELIYTLSESRVIFSNWRDYYNHQRPHRSLGLLTPSEFAKKQLNLVPGADRPTGSFHQEPSTSTTKHNQPKENLSFDSG